MKSKTQILNFTKRLCLLFIIGILFISCENDSEYSRLDANVLIASHFQGAKATVIQLTDHYYPDTYTNFQRDSRKNAAAFAEYLAFEYNIPLHVFEETNKWEEFKEFLKTGRGGASVYYPSCTKSYKVNKLKELLDDIENVYGRHPTTLSYGCGKTYYAEELPNYILGARTSSAPYIKYNNKANTWYGKNCGNDLGIDFFDTKNVLKLPVGGRFYSEIERYDATVDEASKFVTNQVLETISSQGFYTNFMHWHDYYPNKKGDTIEGVKVMPYLFEALKQGIASANTAKIDYNEAIEYLYAKEAIDSVYISKNKESNYRLNFIFNKKRPVDYSVIQTPITVIISKKTLKNLNIKAFQYKSEYGLGTTQDATNIYLNIPLDFSKDSTYVAIEVLNSEENIPIAFQKPKLEENGKGLILCNTESKFVLFRRKKNAPEYEIEIVDRQFDFSKEYKLKGLDNRYDYFCGAINKQRESTLIAL